MAKWLENLECPKCGKGNWGQYDDGSTFCFTAKCGHTTRGDGTVVEQRTAPRKQVEVRGAVMAIPERRLSEKICKKFDVTAETGPDGQIAKINFPWHDRDRDICGHQVRRCGPNVEKKDRFYFSGDKEANYGLFGQQTCRGKGKYITITEGPGDCLAVSEMFDGRYDVVSIRNGAGSAHKELAAELEFLEGYDNIRLCFDNDEPGQEAVDSVKDLFSPHKLSIVSLPKKDAGDMLKAGAVKDFVSCWWDAKQYSPAGIIAASETWNEVLKYIHTPSIPYPWEGLNTLLLGQRTKEVVVWAAETGVGKSQTMREVIHSIIEDTEETVGVLMLEESIAKSMLGWMSFYAEVPLHKHLDEYTDEQLQVFWEQASEGDRFFLLDHRGWQNNIETLMARVRYMAKSLGCKRIILDHLHIALSSVEGATGDWSGIDELVTKLCVLAEEADITLHLVSHVTGGRRLRGSSGIEKLVDAIIYLERDKHHEDVEVANTTTVVVDKNRFAGDVGVATYLRYDRNTGRMAECPKPEGMVEVSEF